MVLGAVWTSLCRLPNTVSSWLSPALAMPVAWGRTAARSASVSRSHARGQASGEKEPEESVGPLRSIRAVGAAGADPMTTGGGGSDAHAATARTAATATRNPLVLDTTRPRDPLPPAMTTPRPRRPARWRDTPGRTAGRDAGSAHRV